MRLLVISPFFPPMANAEAFCGGLFVKALQAAGVDVQVITSSNALPGASTDMSGSWHGLAGAVHDVPNPAGLPFLHRARLSLRYQIASWTAWTDAAVGLAERLHQREPFSAVVSRSLPLQAHYAGFWTARRLGLPWLANINDPLDFAPFVSDEVHKASWSASMDERIWHRRILRNADLVTFPCERLRRHVLRGIDRLGPSADIPHIGTRGSRPERGDRFLLVHAGRLGANELTSRSANTVLDGLQELVRRHPDKRHLIRIRFVGPQDSVLQKGVESLGIADIVEQTGAVSYDESIEHISEASACLLVEGPFQEGVFLPSKLCSYLVANKPVVAVSPATGTVADLSADRGVHHVRREEPRDAHAVLTKLFDAFLSGRLNEMRPTATLTSRYRPDVVADGFLELIAPVVGTPHVRVMHPHRTLQTQP